MTNIVVTISTEAFNTTNRLHGESWKRWMTLGSSQSTKSWLIVTLYVIWLIQSQAFPSMLYLHPIDNEMRHMEKVTTLRCSQSAMWWFIMTPYVNQKHQSRAGLFQPFICCYGKGRFVRHWSPHFPLLATT